MKVNPDEVLKAFKGLAIAAARVREQVEEHGREGLVKGMPRRQEDTLRQHLLELERDVAAILSAMTHRPKS